MATLKVSSKSGLTNALNSADAGDTIVLESGNYGSLSLNGKQGGFSGIKIVSEDADRPAVFDMVNLANVTNMTFDRIRFDYNSNSDTSKPFFFNGSKGISILNSEVDGMLSGGYGTGQGIWVTNCTNFRVENTEIRNFTKNLVAISSGDLKIIGNSFDGASMDAMIFTRIDGVLIQGNSVEMKGKPGVAHRDMIQFTNAENDTSREIEIRGNVLEAAEGGTHGIYMANEYARRTGDPDTFYRDVTIENNTVRSGAPLALAVGEAVGVKISNNAVLQHSAIDSSSGSAIPLILVDKDARSVSINGNTTHKIPQAVESNDNWQPDNYKPSGWTIANNKIVPLGATGGSDGGSSGGGSVAPSTPPAGDSGDGNADEFRYNGGDIDGQERVVFNNVGFKEGDIIMLKNFDAGTFNHYAGDNSVGANTEKTHVWINSLTDIQEIVTAAQDVTAIFQSNDLVMRIAQDAGTVDIVLPGWADDYKDTFNANLF